ncbi:putative alanine racemase-domain-containing protein [Hyaloraphidium curvatum]|nr:putative alanine racemase-domain-containing protein [Hyaloraphidium curvatum]
MKLADHLAFISAPLDAIAKALGEFETLPQQSDEQDAELFKSLFDSRDKIEQIPLLNNGGSATIPSGSLVRFRCMIQDNSLDQQIYQRFYLVADPAGGEPKWQAVKYTDTAPANALPLPRNISEGDLRPVLGDRQPYYAVSVPAETAWAKEAFAAAAPPAATSSSDAAPEFKAEDLALARARYPLPDESTTAAIVLLYNTKENLAVNDVFEVVGILERTQAAEDDVDMDDDMFNLLQTRLPSQDLVPRLHAISFQKLNCAGNPLCLDTELAVRNLAKVNGRAVRAQLVQRISQILGGDTLAAEFVLLHFLSRIYQRDSAITVGNFPMNLCGMSAEATNELVALAEQILPRVHYLPLELAKINGSTFMPRNSETHGLSAGILQLGEGTQLIVDEGKLGEGKVQGIGVLNLQALKTVIDFGKLPFAIFDGTNDESSGEPQLIQNWMEVPVNLNVLIVGTTRSGIFPVECVVPVVAETSSSDGTLPDALSNLTISSADDSKLLADVRLYLGIMREGSYNVSEDMVKYIETDFVTTRARQRQDKASLMSQEELIQLCAVARLVTLSHTTNTLTKELWQEAKSLERRRRERVAAVLPKPRIDAANAGLAVTPVAAS